MTLVNFDNASTGSVATNTALSFSHTTGAQDDMIMLVFIKTDGSTIPVSTVTYNSVNLTFLVGANNTSREECWYLIDPTRGANTLAITTGTSGDIVAGVSTYYGADQENQFINFNSTIGNSTTPGLSVTSDIDGMVVDGLSIPSGGTVTVNGSQTQRWSKTLGTKIAASSDKNATTASTAMSWTLGTSQRWILFLVEVRPVLPPRGSLNLMGVGL